MKRKSEAKDRAVIGDILSATTAEQRAWIGAVALAYNEMQRELHKLAGSCLGFIGIGPAYNVTSRINGTDGLLAIISGAVIAIEIPEEQAKLFNTALSGFGEGKTLRDSVEHVELSDTTTQTGIAPGKRGKGSIDVLLSPNALEGLYKRLVLVKKELHGLEIIFSCAKAIKLFQLFGALDDQRRLSNERDIQDACRFRKLRPFDSPSPANQNMIGA